MPQLRIEPDVFKRMKRYITSRFSLYGVAYFATLFLLSAPHVQAASVTSNTDYWFNLRRIQNQSTVFDDAKDSQTGDPRGELVGDVDNPGFYFAYDKDPLNALNGGRLMFRVRVAAWDTNTNDHTTPGNAAGQFQTSLFIGIDANGDSAIDIFVAADDRGTSTQNGVKIFYPSCAGGTGCFTGPSSTNLGIQAGSTTLFSTTGLSANFDWRQVNSTSDPRTSPGEKSLNQNVNTTTATLNANSNYNNIDGFFSFAVSLADIRAALASPNNPNVSSTIADFNSMTQMRFIAVTAQQENSFNQDTGGCNNNNPVTSWACALSDPVRPGALAPEPGTSDLVIISTVGAFAFSRRRSILQMLRRSRS
jgi:hypothetical protein